MGSSNQREVVTTAAMQQKQQFSPQQGMVPFQDVVSQEHRIYLVPQGIKLDFVSGTHVKSKVSDSEEARPAEHEQNFQDHNARDIQEYLGTQLNSLDNELLVQGILSSEVHNLDVQGDCTVLQGVSNSYGIMDLSKESNNQGEKISNLHLDPSNESMVIGHVPGVAIDGLSPIGSSRFQIPSVMPVCSFTSNQESMYQIASKRMTDSVFSLQDIPDSSAGTSAASIATNDCSLY
ncbi:hypothetical protein BHE74_00035654 [Ensete ventricosum]|nr:hypothetical protein BHE74_00035654 [Ensete ventricosum]RZR91087.1 hypothetical protein BHM03_00019174 [Ensete ventricosum]